MICANIYEDAKEKRHNDQHRVLSTLFCRPRNGWIRMGGAGLSSVAAGRRRVDAAR